MKETRMALLDGGEQARQAAAVRRGGVLLSVWLHCLGRLARDWDDCGYKVVALLELFVRLSRARVPRLLYCGSGCEAARPHILAYSRIYWHIAAYIGIYWRSRAVGGAFAPYHCLS